MKKGGTGVVLGWLMDEVSYQKHTRLFEEDEWPITM